MNAYQIRDRIDFYNDLTRQARFFLSDYVKAFNDATKVFVDDVFEPVKLKGDTGKGFQFDEAARSKIYTLIKTATPSITNGTVVTTRYGSYTPSHINFPTDFYDFAGLDVIIDGYTTFVRPTDYNKKGPLLENIFMKPTNKKPYFMEDSTGMIVWRGVGGTFSTAPLVYIKTPQQLNLGSETDWIEPGGAMLSNGASYIAVEESVQNTNKYLSGTQFTAVGTALTSGKVILASLTATSDLPEKVQETVCKMASDILLGITGNFAAAQFVEKEVDKNN